jgi:hypothetical protein
MVKFFITLFLFCHTAQAGLYMGLMSNSWQDVIPVTYRDSTSGNQVTTYALTSFSTISAGGGYEGQFALRWRYSADLFAHTGTADIHKLVGTVSPRKNATSVWFSTKINYRQSKTFNYGPQLVVNAIQLADVGTATSAGLLLNLEFEMYEGLRLIQSFGSMNDSGTIAYSIGLQKYF